MKFKLVTS